MKVRIYYHHTDSGGVVYYANYLKFLEEARTEFFENLGFVMKDLILRGDLFVVARQEIDYKSPAIYGDILQIDTWVSELSNVRINFENQIKRENDGKLIARAKTVLVHVDKNLKPSLLPDDIRKKIEDAKKPC